MSAAVEGQKPRPIRFERLSTEAGLSQSVVNCFLQDSTGFLWVGTQDGLNRYDGHGFEVFRHDVDDPETLASDFVTALAEDPSGDLRIGTEGGGLARWSRADGTFDSFRHDPEDSSSLSGDRVLDLLWDPSAEVLWIGTLDSGLNRFDPVSGVFERLRHDPTDPDSLASDQLGSIYLDRLGTLWVGTRRGLDRFDADRGAFDHFRHDPENPGSLGDDRVEAILEDRRGAFWVGTRGGLHRRDPETGVFERFHHRADDPDSLSHDWVRALLEDRDGRLWIGTDRGLNLWLESQRRFATYRPDPADPNSLGSDQVLSLYQDRGDVLWISTFGAGISKWHPGKWSFPHYWSHDVDGAGSIVLALSEDPWGALWVGTFGGGLERIERPANSSPGSAFGPEDLFAVGRRIRYRHDPRDPGSLSDNRVTALLHDRRGTLWAGTLAGGLERQTDDGRFVHHRHDADDPRSLPSDAVVTLFEDSRGVLWVGTHGGGLAQHLGDGEFVGHRHDPDDPASLPNDRVMALAEAPGGRLWLATDGGGLALFDPEAGRFVHFPSDPVGGKGPASDELSALHVDARGRLWIGTEGRGFDLLEDFSNAPETARFRNFSAADGLPDDTIWGIRSDLEGLLWLSTNNGLARFDPEGETFRNYSASHGLQGEEFMLGAHFRCPQGELFFGGVNGFNAFFPDRIESNTAVPSIVLTGFSKFDQRVDLGRPIFTVEALSLSHHDRFLTFEFAALDFTSPEQNQYRYQLEGFDDGWVGLGYQRQLTFPSLEPDDYVLRVQGSNNDGVWSDEGLAIAIRVEPPFWNTGWFRVSAVLGFLALVLAVYQARTARIRQNSERLRKLVAARTRELEQAQELLVRKERLAVLGELAGSVAHEIRNPLGVIKNAIFFLRLTERAVDPKTLQHLDLIDQEIRRSNQIIVALLDYAEDADPELEDLSIQQAIQGALDGVEVPSKVLLELRLDDRPARVRADRRQIERILRQLLENAIQAMPDGGELRVDCRPVESDSEPQLVVAIEDRGVGIAEDDLAKVFEPLYTTKFQGIGLGLALARRDAERNGGRLEVESEPGSGSVFRLWLPIHGETDDGA